MPLLITYLLKLSISLAVLYLFYQFALRRLTFYNWNRWYLLSYSILSFFIPFINITGVLNKNELEHGRVVQLVPSVDTIVPAAISPAALESTATFSKWDGLLVVLVMGSVFLLVRLLVQYISYRRIRQKAQLLSSDGVKLYQVNLSIVPFSFGNAIFINQHQYSAAALQEIIRHELVHVQQRHSIDVLISELLCILNWYNPFAWLIRQAIRQNLEFIADDKVLQNGADKKTYQYLLLNVMGQTQFSMASAFNFSSFKKRIIMMNKMKSAPMHLVKFLFVMPIVAVLLLAFRSSTLSDKEEANVYWFTGLTLDAKTQEPIKGVTVVEKKSGIKTLSDDKGFFKIAIPVAAADFETSASFQAPGLATYTSSIYVSSKGRSGATVQFVYLAPAVNATTSHAQAARFDGEPDYNYVSHLFKEHRKSVAQQEKVDKIIGSSNKPIWVIDGIPYAVGNNTKAWFDEDEVKNSPEFRVWVDGKIMTMEEANATIDRFQLHGVGAVNRTHALKKYGVDYNLLLLNRVKREEDWTRVDTVPKD